jgi:5-methyltetrahydropteroyltriglutamate--homocysteine methyltransferase
MASNDYGVLFPASVVGSIPRPQFVLDLISDPEISPADYDRRMEAAVRYVVAMQEHAGLDVLTDGEWWRKSYIGVIAELARGFELGTAPDGRPWTIVTQKLSPKKPGTIAKEVRLLKQITQRHIKATLPAPALLGERHVGPRKNLPKAYPKREDFVRDCVPILRKELELLRDAGATIVQVDDPAPLPLRRSRSSAASTDNADRAADFATDMVNAVVGRIQLISSSPSTSAAAPAPAPAAKPVTAAATTPSSPSSTSSK